jgi:hypothetical protein
LPGELLEVPVAADLRIGDARDLACEVHKVSVAAGDRPARGLVGEQYEVPVAANGSGDRGLMVRVCPLDVDWPGRAAGRHGADEYCGHQHIPPDPVPAAVGGGKRVVIRVWAHLGLLSSGFAVTDEGVRRAGTLFSGAVRRG